MIGGSMRVEKTTKEIILRNNNSPDNQVSHIEIIQTQEKMTNKNLKIKKT